MDSFVLYCKSYRVDVKRVVRLAATVKKFNVEGLRFFVSVPKADLPLFEQFLQGHDVELLSDESIVLANPGIDPLRLASLAGNVSQQIVKSEFWRLGLCRTYLCLDSDCFFIRAFRASDFIDPQGTPYTIMDEGHDLLLSALSLGKMSVLQNFQRESDELKQAFGRTGKTYNFGPNCPVWDQRVWSSLDEKMLKPQQLSFLDLILKSPNEMRWYGEALLRFKAVDLLPSQPFFKMYHYAWQLKKDQQAGIGIRELARLYSGVVYQSAWEREMDWPSEGGSWLSKTARRARARLGRT